MLNLKDDLKVSRGTMKQSRQYEVTIDHAFDDVIAEIQVILLIWFYGAHIISFNCMSIH